SIDWLCWPRFDSGAIFAALLGDEENGHWSLGAATAGARVTRRYRPKTLILETEIEVDGGAATIIDFMPLRRRHGTSRILRLVQGRKGRVELVTELVMRFDYGAIIPWVTRQGDQSLNAIAGPDSVVLHADVPLRPHRFRHQARFSVHAGQTRCFSLGYG